MANSCADAERQVKMPVFMARNVLLALMLIALFGPLTHPATVAAQLAEINPTMDSKSDGGITANPGDTVAYTLTYENTGLNDASGVVLTDTVPANTTFNAGASSPGWSCNPSTSAGSVCTLSLGSLSGNGRAASSVFAVTVDQPIAFNVLLISNSATISADLDDSPGDNVASDTTPINPSADLSIAQSDSPDPVPPGSRLTYTITVNNAGSHDAQNVAVTETLPAGVTLLSTTGCAEDPNGAPTCTLGTVVAGGSAQFTVRVRVNPNATGTLTNTVSVSSSTNDPNGANNSSSADTTAANAAPVPTMTAWGTALFVLLLSLVSTYRLRRAGNQGRRMDT